jgi:hypothetical protein
MVMNTISERKKKKERKKDPNQEIGEIQKHQTQRPVME